MNEGKMYQTGWNWWVPALCLALPLLCVTGACVDRPELHRELGGFNIKFVPDTDLGSEQRPLSMGTPSSPHFFTVDIEALRNDALGELDKSYNGVAVITPTPSGRTDKTVYTVKFTDGVATGVKVGVYLAHGPIRLLVTDVGYTEPDKAGDTPACNNGKDDDDDGYIDDMDRGCYTLGDNSETGGTNATGASEVVHFGFATISDVQRPVPEIDDEASPLAGERVSIRSGWMLVTRVGTDGMYVTDFAGVKFDGKQWQVKPQDLEYDSVFAFNFSTPLNLQLGDCLVQLDGTVEEFYGYTEMSKPAWKKGDQKFCAAKALQAGVAACAADVATCRLRVEELANTPVKLTTYTVTEGGKTFSVWDTGRAERFEAGLVMVENLTMFSYAATCDKNGDGLADFANTKEGDCMRACQKDTTCIIQESYNQYNQWTVLFTDGAKAPQRVAVITAGALPAWDPIKAAADAKAAGAPMKLNGVVGTMRHLIFGKPPWILETRSPADCPQCVNKIPPPK